MKITSKLIILICFSLITISCSHKLQFNTYVQKSKDFDGIKTLTVGEVRLVKGEELILNDNLGNWSSNQKNLKVRGIERIVKQSLISNLNRFSDYNVVDLDEFRVIYGDSLTSIKPISGLIVKEVDGILNIKFSLYVTSQNGQYEEIKTFYRNSRSKIGKKWKTTEDSSSQRVVRVPYQLKNATITLTGELIRVTNGEIELLKTFSDVIVVSLGSEFTPPSFIQNVEGGFISFFKEDHKTKDQKIGSLPFYQLNHTTVNEKPSDPVNLIGRIGVLISNTILPKFGRYKLLTTRTIDTGGDSISVDLLKQGDIEGSKTRIEDVMTDENERTSENLYNLGVCYEVLGETGISRQLYEESLELDEGNSSTIETLGNLENKTL